MSHISLTDTDVISMLLRHFPGNYLNWTNLKLTNYTFNFMGQISYLEANTPSKPSCNNMSQITFTVLKAALATNFWRWDPHLKLRCYETNEGDARLLLCDVAHES